MQFQGFLLDDEQKALQEMVRDFVDKEVIPVAAQCDITGELPMEVYKKACDMGLNCPDLPEEYGGMGISYLTGAVIREELSRGDAGFSLTLGANSLGMKPVLIAGTEAQKRRVANILLSGGFSSFALTEPDAGSDAAACTTTAVKAGDEYILNGRKCFITNSAYADIMTVVATVDRRGLTMFLVDAKTPGLSVGKHENKMGIRMSATCDVVFEDVKVPASSLIGAEGMGFQIAMKTLDKGRASIAGGAVGIARAAFEHAVKYAQQRKTFGKPIISNQAIQFMLADMSIGIETARQMGFYAAALVDAGSPMASKIGAISKCYSTDMLQKVVSDAVQIFGGYGYSREYPLEKLMRDAKIFQIFEGTNQIQRMVIANHLMKEYEI